MAPSAVSTLDDISCSPKKPISNNDMSAMPILENAERTDLVVRAFRCLIADLCEQFKGGHPG